MATKLKLMVATTAGYSTVEKLKACRAAIANRNLRPFKEKVMAVSCRGLLNDFRNVGRKPMANVRDAREIATIEPASRYQKQSATIAPAKHSQSSLVMFFSP